jgi:TPP-dependent pyruvate/acetoin dehydrogenase alpha subunit
MVEVMAGVALAFRLRMEPRAAILVDTADSSASGYWHEGLNLAAVQRAPLVLVVDGARRQPLTAAVDRLAARAPAYGIRAVTVEGDDPHLVFEAVAEAAARARLGEGTQLVEVVPGSAEDPVERLVRLEPSRADAIEEMRALALVEAKEAADAASAAPAPDESDARYPVLVPSSSENSP